jgi:hypothetical protein
MSEKWDGKRFAVEGSRSLSALAMAGRTSTSTCTVITDDASASGISLGRGLNRGFI